MVGVDGDNKEREVEVLSALSKSRTSEVAVRRLGKLASDVSPRSSPVNRALPLAKIKSKL